MLTSEMRKVSMNNEETREKSKISLKQAEKKVKNIRAKIIKLEVEKNELKTNKKI